MTQGLRTFLTFQGGVAKAALDLDREAFADFELTAIALYGAGGPGPTIPRSGSSGLEPNVAGALGIGFDSFAGFPSLHEEDGALDANVQKEVGGLSSENFLDEFRELLKLHNEDGVLPTGRGQIVEGDISKTLPEWLEKNPESRFCLINVDVDIYEPTKTILEHCWDRLVPGGVLILDEYATSKWPGETRAWDDFARKNGIAVPVKRFPWANAPGGYIVKGA